jgi:hypothetical protein
MGSVWGCRTLCCARVRFLTLSFARSHREHESVTAKPKVFSAERKVPDGLEKHAFRRHVWDNVSAVLCRFLRLHGPGAHDYRHEDGWLAWIPIANIILMLNIAKKPIWWIILFLVPLVNIVMIVLIWMGIAEARNKPSWWGILIIIPIVNLIVPGYLAWVD